MLLAQKTEKYYPEIMKDSTLKGELKEGGIKFLSNVSTWIGYAAALGFYVNLQVEQYEAIDTKFKEQGKSYVEDLYNRIKSDTTEVMD